MTIPANSYIYGDDGATILVWVPSAFTCPGSNVHIRNVGFDSSTGGAANPRHIYFSTGGTTRLTVDRCSFIGSGGSTGVYGENQTSEITVKNCEFSGGSAGVILLGTLRSEIHSNRFLAVSRAIEILGGSTTRVINNRTQNGITGILFISQRTNGRFNNTAGNLIQGNYIADTSEEGISFDCRGNSSTLWPENGTNPIVTFASISNNSNSQRAMVISETGQGLNWATSYYAIALTGNNLGHVLLISGSGNGFIDIERSNGDGAVAGWTVGDKLLITMPFQHNTVIGNTCVGCARSSIIFYGSSWWNTVIGNTISGCGTYGITLASVVAGLGSSGAWGVQCWSGFNLVKGNTIQMIRSGESVSSGHVPIFCGLFPFGSPPAVVQMPGNRIVDNLIDSSQFSQIESAAMTQVLGNSLAPGGSFTMSNTDYTTYGRNYIAGILDAGGAGLTDLGGNTNTTIIATP